MHILLSRTNHNIKQTAELCKKIVADNDKAILIDTDRKKYCEKILERCKKFHVSLIVFTHGHMDHCQNAAYLAEALHIPIAMHCIVCCTLCVKHSILCIAHHVNKFILCILSFAYYALYYRVSTHFMSSLHLIQ